MQYGACLLKIEVKICTHNCREEPGSDIPSIFSNKLKSLREREAERERKRERERERERERDLSLIP